jgi:hypothetical protein
MPAEIVRRMFEVLPCVPQRLNRRTNFRMRLGSWVRIRVKRGCGSRLCVMRGRSRRSPHRERQRENEYRHCNQAQKPMPHRLSSWSESRLGRRMCLRFNPGCPRFTGARSVIRSTPISFKWYICGAAHNCPHSRTVPKESRVRNSSFKQLARYEAKAMGFGPTDRLGQCHIGQANLCFCPAIGRI